MSKLAARMPLRAQAVTMKATLRLPKAVRRAIAGRPIVLDGQTLALDAQVLLRLVALTEVSLSDQSPAEARAELEDTAGIAVGPPIDDVTTRDLDIPGPRGAIPARLYVPADVPEPAPLLVFYHGGGFCLGSIETHDYAVKFLAKHAGVRALSVDYRLAPDHKFPAGVDDSLAAFDYAHKHADQLGVDQNRIAVGGDSAGGTMSAVVAQQATLRGGPAPAFQLLFYPEPDIGSRRRSRELFADGFFLTDADMTWFEGHYLAPEQDRSDPRVAPLRAVDLSGLPPAYLVTAGFDPLRDGGAAYAEAMRESGVGVVYRCQEDLIHGFLNFVALGARFREATLEAASALRTGLALSSS